MAAHMYVEVQGSEEMTAEVVEFGSFATLKLAFGTQRVTIYGDSVGALQELVDRMTDALATPSVGRTS